MFFSPNQGRRVVVPTKLKKQVVKGAEVTFDLRGPQAGTVKEVSNTKCWVVTESGANHILNLERVKVK